MALDIIFSIGTLIAFIYGFKKGFISSLFSFIAILVAVLAAVHLSVVCSEYLQKWFHIKSGNLPIFSFVIILIVVFIIFWILSKLIEGVFKIMHINFINKLAGAAIWILGFMMLFSTLLVYANNMKLISDATKNESRIYSPAIEFAPKASELIGKIIPPVKNIFNSLQQWFEQQSK